MTVEFKQDQDNYRYPAIVLNGQHVGALVPIDEKWSAFWFGEKPKLNRMDGQTIADKLEELEREEGR